MDPFYYMAFAVSGKVGYSLTSLTTPVVWLLLLKQNFLLLVFFVIGLSIGTRSYSPCRGWYDVSKCMAQEVPDSNPGFPTA